MFKGVIGEFMFFNVKWNLFVFFKFKIVIVCWNDVKNNVIYFNWIYFL